MLDGVNSYTQYSPNFGNNNAGFYKGLQGAAVANSQDINNMARYVLGAPEEHQESLNATLSGTIPFMGIFGSLQAFPWLKDNFKHPIDGMKKVKADYIAKNPDARFKLSANASDVLKEHKKRLFSGLSDAEKLKLQENRGFLGKGLDMIPGYKKLRTSGFGQLMGKSGAGWMIVIDGGIKLFTDIIPTFDKLGTGAGVKQIGKSAAMVASSAAGWTAGEVAGSAAGAAIGTAICPGVGTVIGKFAGGFLGGTIGLYFANKATKAVVGESELNLAAKNLENEASTNEAAQQMLAQQALAKAENDLQINPNNTFAQQIKIDADKILAGSMVEQADAAEEQYNQVQQELGAAPAQFGSLSGVNIPPVPGFNGMSYDMDAYRQAMSTASMPTLKAKAAI